MDHRVVTWCRDLSPDSIIQMIFDRPLLTDSIEWTLIFLLCFRVQRWLLMLLMKWMFTPALGSHWDPTLPTWWNGCSMKTSQQHIMVSFCGPTCISGVDPEIWIWKHRRHDSLGSSRGMLPWENCDIWNIVDAIFRDFLCVLDMQVNPSDPPRPTPLYMYVGIWVFLAS